MAPGEIDGPYSYVALGDSISIDDYSGGPGRGGASLLYANRDDDFPDWRGRDLATRYPGSQLELLALDGGTVETVLEVELPQLVRLGRRPDLVSLTVGGNDLLQAYGDTGTARFVVREVGAGVGEVPPSSPGTGTTTSPTGTAGTSPPATPAPG